MNIGGPAIQAITLTKRLEPLGYTTTLVRGREGEHEGSMDDLASELGVVPTRVDSLRRDPGPYDLRALLALFTILRRNRPQIVHTHAAKGGTIGRLAALIAFPRRRSRPVLVHTFHGHSLSGYFSERTAAVYRVIERFLARRTDRLIAVSDEVRDDLIGFGVAGPERFEVIPLGFDLAEFVTEGRRRAEARADLRAELGIPDDAVLVTLVARLVPIKRVDRFLEAAAALSHRDQIHFLIVGDGELRRQLASSPAAMALGHRLSWAGFRRDMPAVYCASDIVALTSDNEGTPVSLIEAAAAGVPTISTRVGGASAVVLDGQTGVLVSNKDPEAVADALSRLVGDQAARSRMGAAASAHALRRFSLERLVGDVDDLYRRLLASKRSA